jgi:hypothetical protein
VLREHAALLADQPLMPAAAAPLELADRQCIEELVGDEQ